VIRCGESPSKKRKRASADTPTKTRLNSSEQWWRRLHIKAEHLHLPYHVQKLLDKPALEIMNPSWKLAFRHAKESLEVLSTAVGYMFQVRETSATVTLITIVMHMFFYIALQKNPRNWAERLDKKPHSILGTMAEDLYVRCATSPPSEMDLKAFKRKLKECRRIGGVYCYLATHLGVGSLVHLLDSIGPKQMWGGTKGNEIFTGQKRKRPSLKNKGEGEGEEKHDRIEEEEAQDGDISGRPSTNAFGFLRHEGLVKMAVVSGTQQMIFDLLWEVFEKLPEFGERRGKESFPGSRRWSRRIRV
jgi:hypothetical protein